LHLNRDVDSVSCIIGKFQSDTSIEMNAIIIPWKRRTIVMWKWIEKIPRRAFEEVNLEGSLFHTRLAIIRVKIFRDKNKMGKKQSP